MALSKDRDRLDKIIAVAINPSAYEDEAISALRRARELVRQNPSLAHPPAPQAPATTTAPALEASYQSKITNIRPFWLPVLLDNLSKEAYGLGLRSKLEVDFSGPLFAVDVRCDGSKAACETFKAHMNWLIAYINSQPPQPTDPRK